MIVKRQRFQTVVGALVGSVLFSNVHTAVAAEQTITVNAIFEKSVYVTDAFGSTLDSLPANFSLVFEDSDPGIVDLPAGTQVRSDGAISVEGATLVPLSAVVSLTATIGDGVWEDVSSIVTRDLFDSGYSYAVLVDGGIENPVGLDILVQDLSVGALEFGYFLWNCNYTTECLTTNTGEAYDIHSGNHGYIHSIELSLDGSEATPEEQILDLQDEVAVLGIDAAILDAVSAKLEKQRGNSGAASNMMNAFINRIEAQRGKRLTDTQADDHVARAQAVIESL